MPQAHGDTAKYYSNFICTMLTIAFLLIANIQYLHLFIVRNFV